MTDLRYPIGKFQPPTAYTPEQRAQAIDDLRTAAAQLRRAVAGLDATQLQTPYREGGWTVAQVVHHLADSHINAFMRFRMALTVDNPTIVGYNEALWARLADASSTDLEASLDLFEAVHRRLVPLLRTLTAEDLARTYVHPERGPSTLDRALALYAWHGRHHVAHITSLRERMSW
jgi:uncharacterized damage-inducible protein DinB